VVSNQVVSPASRDGRRVTGTRATGGNIVSNQVVSPASRDNYKLSTMVETSSVSNQVVSPASRDFRAGQPSPSRTMRFQSGGIPSE
jgi:hypothetical protein